MEKKERIKKKLIDEGNTLISYFKNNKGYSINDSNIKEASTYLNKVQKQLKSYKKYNSSGIQQHILYFNNNQITANGWKELIEVVNCIKNI